MRHPPSTEKDEPGYEAYVGDIQAESVREESENKREIKKKPPTGWGGLHRRYETRSKEKRKKKPKATFIAIYALFLNLLGQERNQASSELAESIH